MEKIIIKPIGIARNDVEKSRFGGWDKVISEIILNEEYREALDGIDDYSHLIVLFWMDQVKACKIKHQPQGIGPLVGILACRCPARPNPIAITTVKLLEHKGNRLKVKGLDVINNTPIIDIKPYTPQYDEVKDAKAPAWINELEY